MPTFSYRYRLFALPLFTAILLLVSGNRSISGSKAPAAAIDSNSINQQVEASFQQYLPAIINPGRILAQTSGYPAGHNQSSFFPTYDEFETLKPAARPAQPGPIDATGTASTKSAATQGITPEFQQFIDFVADGEASTVRGLYVEGVLALRVVQQPEKDPLYVSTEEGVATQFQNAALKGVVGLLAHNFLSGADFYKLRLGQEVYTVDGDKKVIRYRIDGIQTYQKLKPQSPTSDFIDLQTNERKTSSQVFKNVYSGKSHLTLQTCLKKGENWSWGLLFVIANPVE